MESPSTAQADAKSEEKKEETEAKLPLSKINAWRLHDLMIGVQESGSRELPDVAFSMIATVRRNSPGSMRGLSIKGHRCRCS